MAPRADPPLQGAEPAALVFFLLALGAGCAVIYALPAAWLVPAVLVVAYTVVLRVGRNEAERPLSDTLRDSPYYLGFLLTQVALVALFLRFRPELAADLTRLSQGLATALSTSIVGLIARQVVVLTTPRRHRRESELELGEGPLRLTIADYQSSQKDFVSFLDEFLTQREQLMESERAASRNYVKAVRSTLSSLQRVQEKISDNLEKSAQQSSELLDQSHSSMLEAVTGTAESLAAETRVIRDRLAALEQEITRTAKSIRDTAPAADLESLRAASAATTDAMRALADAGTVLGKTASETSSAAVAILEDLKAVDSILSEFVEIAVKRIQDLDRLDGPS